MNKLLCGFIVFVATLSPVHAVTCADGMKVIEQMSNVLDLSELEKSNIEALITKAKIEDEQGRQRNCKIILADAIRFFLIKTVID
jgi:hypothetical protein